MNKSIKQTLDTPWKATEELKMFIYKVLGSIYLRLFKKVDLGVGYKLYGLPKVFRHRNSSIKIGVGFENRNTWYSNPLGVNHPTIICTWKENARITIGKNVGITGGAIVASASIEIGDGTLIGANSTIIDTDFHPIKVKDRRYKKNGVKSKSVKIGKNVFIGMNCIILKGAIIRDDAVIPAGSIIR